MIPSLAKSVSDAFGMAVTRWPERPFLNVLPETAALYDIPAGETSFAAADAEVTHLSNLLFQAGYGAGHRVLLLLENRPEFFLWWLALNRLGASVVPVNPDLRLAEQTYIIGHAEPVLAVVIPARCGELRAAADVAGLEMAVISSGQPIPAPRTNARIAKREGAAEAALLYTSGTTGQPKGCVLTDDYFLQAGHWYADTGGLCALGLEGERMITPLPVFHMNAMAYSFMAMVAVGGCLTVLDRFHPRSWWANVRDSGATCLHYLGVMPSMLMGLSCAYDREHSVRFGFGAGVDQKLHASFEGRFGFPLIEAWAMTETGAGAVICANREPRRVGESCLGKPEGDLQVQIAGGDQGELLVRRAGDTPRKGFFVEYFKNPEATAEAWQGGWFHTGDIVRRDADGSIFFVDRKKNVIRRSGENIAAVEVESTLMRHPAITAAAVTAVPDPLRGDEVFACLVVNTAPEPALAEQITRWCLEQLAYYKAPGYIAFVVDLPLTATQKIQRAALKARAEELLREPATVDIRHLKKRTAA